MSTDTTASDEGVSPAQLEYVSLLILLSAEFIIALTFSLPWSVSPPTPMAHLFVFPPSIINRGHRYLLRRLERERVGVH